MKRRSFCLASFTLSALFALCVMAVLVVVVTLAIPRRAAQTFGLPSNRLDTPEQLYYAALLVMQEQSLIRPVDPQGSPRPFRIELG